MASVHEYREMQVLVPYFYEEVEALVRHLSPETRRQLARGPLGHHEGCRLCKVLGYPAEMNAGTLPAHLALSAYHNCIDVVTRDNPPRYKSGLVAVEDTMQARCFLVYALARSLS